MILSAKLTCISFVVALAFLAGGAFATPTTERSTHYADHSTSAFDFDKSFKTLAGNAKWIFDHLTTVIGSIIGEKVEYLFSWMADIAMRMEFLIMADGSHFMFPECGQPDMEQKHREFAVAVWKLLRNLKTMERTNEVLKNVMIRALRRGPANITMNSSQEKIMSAFLSTYFETMDRTFEEDEVLGVEYKNQKVEAKKEAKPNAKMHEAFIKAWEHENKTLLPSFDKEAIAAFLRDKDIFRQAFANKIFMKEAVKNIAMIFNKTHLERYRLARALINKANESSEFDSKVNQVYLKALFRAGGVMYMFETADVIQEVLFDAIQKGMEADRTLHYEILMASTKPVVYDSEMLNFDFSPL